MATLTLRYHAIARTVSGAGLATALGALPLDTSISDLAGLTLSSDNATNAGNVATRTIVYTTDPAESLIPDANLVETSTGWYTLQFEDPARE